MTIKSFIEKAVEGGWAKGRKFDLTYANKGFIEEVGIECATDDELTEREPLANQVVFLDPDAWRAVGKVEVWEDIAVCEMCGTDLKAWKLVMHDMIDALTADKTIEEFLATL